MRLLRVIIFLMLLVTTLDQRVSSCRAQDANSTSGEVVNDPVHAVHVALFASFFPVDALARETQTATLLKMARDEMWLSGATPAFRDLLAPFADLRSFGTACGI
ncbi:MAG TPA: hypothetical protein VF126_13445, partial [Acidobacteriaceae bacterium]